MMTPQLFGKEHILYIILSAVLTLAVLLTARRLLKTERAQGLFLRGLALLLFAAILTNRLSQVFRYDTVRWYALVPDSFCGMTSLLLSSAVLFGKRDNPALHFTWPLGLFGGVSTVIYATFVGQGPTIFYLPTISGLLHHSLSAMLAVAILMFRYVDVTYKKWYYTFFGFTCYLTLGAFMMQAFPITDAFHIAEPLLPGTPLTAWVMAPMYAAGYALILLIAELVKRKRKRRA
jgi:hypothetical protein